MKWVLISFIILIAPLALYADHDTNHTIAQLQEQITSLQAKLQALIATSGGSEDFPPSAPIEVNESAYGTLYPSFTCPMLRYTLMIGSTDKATGLEVSQLQQFLATDSAIYPEGLVTGYYGNLTKRAVQRWQIKYGVVSSVVGEVGGYGTVGPKTRTKIREQCSPREDEYVLKKDEFLIKGIAVRSPNGGEVWVKGSTQEIRWEARGQTRDEPGNIKIMIFYMYPVLCEPYRPCSLLASVGYTVVEETPNDGAYQWVVGQNLAQVIIPENKYFVHIYRADDMSIDDASDDSFQIVDTLPPSPIVSSLMPSRGVVGTQVIIHGSGFTPMGNTIRWGDVSIGDFPSPDGETIQFSVPDGLRVCPSPDSPDFACGAFAQIRPGNYVILVTNANGQSNAITFTVTSIDPVPL